MRIEFEWQISDPQWRGNVKIVWVRERLAGTNHEHILGPMPIEVAESFVTARRQMVDRNIKTKYQAVNIFEARPNLAALSQLSKVPVVDDEDEGDSEMPIPNFPEH